MDEDISNRNYILEEVGDTTALQLYADEFEHLTKKDRLLAYYLVQAALAGRDTFWLKVPLSLMLKRIRTGYGA